MIIGSIQQVKEQLITDNTNIACQYAENLQMEIKFDGTYNNYSWLFFCGYNFEQPKAVPIEYNPTNRLITLPAEAFIKSGVLYIQAVAIKGEVKFPLNPVAFTLNQSLPQNFISTSPTELEILKDLIEQIVKNEYDSTLQGLIKKANEEQQKAVAQQKEADRLQQESVKQQGLVNEKMNDLTEAVERGDFVGPIGPRGIQGIQGKQGVIGPQGVNLRLKGAWSSSIAYVNNTTFIDIVSYNGSTYGCIKTHTSSASILPTNTTYWSLLAQKGDKGEIGSMEAIGQTEDYLEVEFSI